MFNLNIFKNGLNVYTCAIEILKSSNQNQCKTHCCIRICNWLDSPVKLSLPELGDVGSGN